MYCTPSIEYVTGPGTTLPWVSIDQTSSPVSARNAESFFPDVPWNTRLPAVVSVPALPLPSRCFQAALRVTGSQASR